MEIKINKEIREYSESIFFGLSMRQCLFSVLACIVAIGIYFACHTTFGTEITSWLCMFGAFPFATFGFITYQQMYMEEIIVVSLRSFRLILVDLVNKPINIYHEILKDKIKKNQEEEIHKNDKKFIKSKKIKQRKI